MRAVLSIVSCLVMLAVTSRVLQAGIVAPFGTPDNYGFWYDRDGVDPWQDADPNTPSPGGSSVPWGSVNGGTYNTQGIYNVQITYHAVTANTATMFATINGIQQGFYTNGYKNAQPDIYPAGLSFTSDYLTAMQAFYTQWVSEEEWYYDAGCSCWQPRFKDGTYTGDAVISNLRINGTTTGPTEISLNYANRSSVLQFGPVWDLTAGDLVLSYDINLSSISTNPTMIVYALGLKPESTSLGINPAGGGWMGNVVSPGQGPNPNTLNLNDKFDLQNGPGDERSYNVTVAEPSFILLLGFGLSAVTLLVARFRI